MLAVGPKEWIDFSTSLSPARYHQSQKLTAPQTEMLPPRTWTFISCK